ncbi:hypothetical protein D3C76_1047220 [compost metagenome]
MIQQTDEVGIGPVVEDDETRIDGKALTLYLNVNRMAMATNPVTRLEYGDIMLTVEQVGAGQPGDTATNDGYFHEDSSVTGRAMSLPSANCRRWGNTANSRRAAMNGPGKAISSGRLSSRVVM